MSNFGLNLVYRHASNAKDVALEKIAPPSTKISLISNADATQRIYVLSLAVTQTTLQQVLDAHPDAAVVLFAASSSFTDDFITALSKLDLDGELQGMDASQVLYASTLAKVLRKRISHVVLLDFLESSLSMLQNALCWDVKDVVFAKDALPVITKKRPGKSAYHERAFNTLFTELNIMLQEQISSLSTKHVAAVATLQDLIAKAHKKCDTVLDPLDCIALHTNNKDFETLFRMGSSSKRRPQRPNKSQNKSKPSILHQIRAFLHTNE